MSRDDVGDRTASASVKKPAVLVPDWTDSHVGRVVMGKIREVLIENALVVDPTGEGTHDAALVKMISREAAARVFKAVYSVAPYTAGIIQTVNNLRFKNVQPAYFAVFEQDGPSHVRDVLRQFESATRLQADILYLVTRVVSEWVESGSFVHMAQVIQHGV